MKHQTGMTGRNAYFLLAVFCFLAAGIILAGFISYRNFEKRLRDQVESQLSSIADLKAAEIKHWKNEESIEYASVFYWNAAFSAQVRRFFENPQDADAGKQLESWLEASRRHLHYDRISLVDAGGSVRFSIPEAKAREASLVERRIVEALKTRRVEFVDFYRNEHEGRIYLNILVPMIDERDGSTLGVLSMRIDPEEHLYPYIGRWPGQSRSAETMLIRRDGEYALYLNDLRFRKDTALKLRVPLSDTMKPSVKAVLGQTGIVEGIDYQGVPVIADVRPVADTPWFVVASVHKAEVFSPLRERLALTFAFVLVLLMGTGAAAGFVWRQQSVLFYRERYEKESALRASEARFRVIFQQSPIAIELYDASGVLVGANPSCLALFGVEDEQEIKGFNLFADPNIPDEEKENLRQGREVRYQAAFDFDNLKAMNLYRTSREGLIWLDVLITPLDDDDGAGPRGGFLVQIQDITERTLKDEALKQKELKLRVALDGSESRERQVSSLLIAARAVLETSSFADTARRIFDLCRQLLGAASGYVALLSQDGHENEVLFLEAGGLPCSVDPGLPMPIRGLRADAYRTGKPVFDNDFAHSPWMEFMPEGHVSLNNVLFAPLNLGGRTVGLLGIANKPGGFTEEDSALAGAFAEIAAIALSKVRDEDALRESEERYRKLFSSMVAGFALHEILCDEAGKPVDYRFLEINQAFEHMTGLNAASAVGRTVREMIPGVEDCWIETYGKVALSGEPIHFENYSSMLGKHYEVSAYCPKKGQFATIFLDITERKNSEALLQDKNAELERFTYTVSHDLKSPLVTIKTFLGYLEQDLLRPDEGRVGSDMQYIRTAADKMGRLLDEVLEMSRVGRVMNPPEEASFRELVDEALSAVAGSIAQRGVAVQVGTNELMLYGDRPRLVEIWQNLIENAVKFMGDQHSPCIEIGVERTGSGTVFFVRDNGMGIEPQYREKVFCLFEKLDAGSEGTGLGLALIKRIVESHRGTICIESQGAGRGSCFRFSLPDALSKNSRSGGGKKEGEGS